MALLVSRPRRAVGAGQRFPLLAAYVAPRRQCWHLRRRSSFHQGYQCVGALPGSVAESPVGGRR
eukprot:822815-Lingulodinium_polyedra.AAC.1